MSNTLITFLGRTPRTEQGYRTTRYDFGDGSPQEHAFFGWALHQRLRPKRMVILGTAGSMWDHLFEGDVDLGDREEADRMVLMEAVDAKSVPAEILERLAPSLSQVLETEVHLQLIPYCRTEAEQVELLRVMADHVHQEDQVHIDVTHGFRHLPMLALLSALHLRISRDADVQGIWYGAFDPDTGQAPVHDLSGLLRIADGIEALSSFDKDGDYGVFIPLFQACGLPSDQVQALSRAAYYENVLNVSAATGELRKARPMLVTPSLPPELELLRPAIEERLDWLDEDRQFEKQTRLARRALQRRDYLRAVLYAFEAVVTRICQLRRVSPLDFTAREEVRKDYESDLKRLRNDEFRDYRLLKNLRNQVAHGSRGDTKIVQTTLLDESEMQAQLDRLLGLIEQGKLPSGAD